MENNNTTTLSGKMKKCTETKTALLTDAAKLMRNIAEALDETSRGEDSFTVICRRRNLDAKKVQQLLQTSTFRNCSLFDTVDLKDLGKRIFCSRRLMNGFIGRCLMRLSLQS